MGIRYKYPVNRILKEISEIFESHSFSVYLVGGAIRDYFLGKKASDWDIATNAQPDQVQKLFKRTIPTGIEHGTVTILFKNKTIECTTFRSEADYSDSRHPASVSYICSIEEDLSRRDFTMNAIAAELPSGRILDPFDGINDIKNGLIKTVGSPQERFKEDGLRPIRAIRFAAQLEFEIETETLVAIPSQIEAIKKISIERFRDEFSKLMQSKSPIIGLRLLESTGLLEFFLPELQACRNVEQKGLHRFDVLDHLFLTCSACPPEKLHIRLAGLFHDIGKPCVKKEENGICTFYNHEMYSEKICIKIMQRLKYPNKIIQITAHLIKQHMFHYEDNWTDAAVRRFLVRVGAENLPDLFSLRIADGFGRTGTVPNTENLTALQKRVNDILKQEQALSLKDLAINGNDLLKMGIPAGRKIGLILTGLFETVLDDPEQNKKELLLKIAQSFYERLL